MQPLKFRKVTGITVSLTSCPGRPAKCKVHVCPQPPACETPVNCTLYRLYPSPPAPPPPLQVAMFGKGSMVAWLPWSRLHCVACYGPKHDAQLVWPACHAGKKLTGSTRDYMNPEPLALRLCFAMTLSRSRKILQTPHVYNM